MEGRKERKTYVNDVKSLVNGTLSIERETGINLSRNLSRDDIQDLLSELDQETIEGGISLLVEVLAVSLAVLDSGVNQLGVFGLLGCGEDEGGVGGGILGLVFANGCGESVWFVERIGQAVDSRRGCIGWRRGRWESLTCEITWREGKLAGVPTD